MKGKRWAENEFQIKLVFFKFFQFTNSIVRNFQQNTVYRNKKDLQGIATVNFQK